MKPKSHHKKMSPGLAAKLIRETPREYTGDLNDKKALAAYQRGEVVHQSAEVIQTDFRENLKDLNDRLNKRKEIVRGLDAKLQAEMPVEDKVKRAVTNTIKKVKGFIRRKI